MRKQVLALLLSSLMLLAAACGCSRIDPVSDPVKTFQVVEVDGTALLVMESGSSFGLFRVGTKDAQIIDEKGREITQGDICPGMVLEFEGIGAILESYPGQFDVSSVRVVEQGDDLVGLYRRVLCELWETDPALNENITTVGLDLSGLSNLSEVERNALKYTLECDVWTKTGKPVSVVTGTWQELCDEGYIDGENLYWEDGVFLSLSVTRAGDREFTFEAEKWRSGTGAVWFKSCTAKQGKAGQWDFEIGGFAIA